MKQDYNLNFPVFIFFIILTLLFKSGPDAPITKELKQIEGKLQIVNVTKRFVIYEYRDWRKVNGINGKTTGLFRVDNNYLFSAKDKLYSNILRVK